DVVAVVVERLRGPSEPALLIMRPSRVGAFVRRRGVFAIRIVELALDTPDDVGGERPIAAHRVESGLVEGERAGALQTRKWVLNLPDQFRRCRRICPETPGNTHQDSRRECVATHDVPPTLSHRNL